MTKIYVDTNVYLDYFEGRTDYMRPLGDFAYEVFQRTLSCEFTIVFSSLILDELEHNIKSERIADLLLELEDKNKIIKIVPKREEREIARKIVKERNTPFNDTLHALLAKNSGSDYFITRNIKDFLELQDFVKILLPEHL